MRVAKGQRLTIVSQRKGTFDAIALRDFDTEADEWWPVAVDQEMPVEGLSPGKCWDRGEEIPCRRSLSTATLRDASPSPAALARECRAAVEGTARPQEGCGS